MKKNVILADHDVSDDWEYKVAIENTTNEHWDLKVCLTNRLHGNKIKEIIRYFKYFVFSFKIFLKRNEYHKIIAWQQFYGLLIAFYCKIFKVKKYPDIYVMTFIYKPKKNKIYNKFINYIVKSKYIKKLIVLAESEIDYYSNLFNIEKNKFYCIPIGVSDCSLKIKKQSDIDKFYLAVGRSNRDYTFLRNAWKKEYGKLIIISDSYNEEEKENIVCIKNCYGDEYLQMLANCYAEIIPLKDPEISSGSLSFLQAMMLSKPTIVTENKTVHDYIKTSENGYIIEKNEIDLENAIILLEDKKNYERVSQNARKTFEEKYSETSLGVNTAKMIMNIK